MGANMGKNPRVLTTSAAVPRVDPTADCTVVLKMTSGKTTVGSAVHTEPSSSKHTATQWKTMSTHLEARAAECMQLAREQDGWGDPRAQAAVDFKTMAVQCQTLAQRFTGSAVTVEQYAQQAKQFTADAEVQQSSAAHYGHNAQAFRAEAQRSLAMAEQCRVMAKDSSV